MWEQRGRMRMHRRRSLHNWAYWCTRAGDTLIPKVWLRHVLAVALLFWLIGTYGSLHPAGYFIAAYFGMGLLMVSSFIEHQAVEKANQRSVIIETRGPLSLLFLNNNFHSVHHAYPSLAWYRIPAFFRENRARFLRMNGGYRYQSYWEVFRRFGLDGEPVGAIFLVHDESDPDRARLRMLHVEASARGRGVGSMLVEACIDKARAFAEMIGKKSAVVSDRPGFATSRLDLVQALEAIRMVQDGVASAEDIDRAITTAYRHPVGPLRLSDMVGLDVRLDIATHLSTVLGPHFAPPQLLQDMVARGELGQKSGKGFYDWPTPEASAQQGSLR